MRPPKFVFFYQCALVCSIIFNQIASLEGLIGHNIRQAGTNEFPFIAGVIRKNRNFEPQRDTVCTAALISKRDVLTSEHCLLEETFNEVEVVAGSINLVSNSKYNVTWWMSFDQWSVLRDVQNSYDSNDLSIIRLTTQVANGISYAEISYTPYTNLKEKNVVAVGWGENNNGSFPRILRTASLKILRNSVCRYRIKNVAREKVKVDKNLVCTAGQPYTMLMNGDSGGPLLYANKIVGVNMGTCPFPEQIYNFNKINVHVNIYFYQNFITEMISDN